GAVRGAQRGGGSLGAGRALNARHATWVNARVRHQPEMLMKRRPLLVLGALSPLTAFLPAAHGAAIGQTAPDFTLTDTSGKPVRLSDFRGRHVVLEWNNPGCPFVRKHYEGNMQ